jgi:hypothetical protein
MGNHQNLSAKPRHDNKNIRPVSIAYQNAHNSKRISRATAGFTHNGHTSWAAHTFHVTKTQEELDEQVRLVHQSLDDDENT